MDRIKTPERGCWQRMIYRCTKPSDPSYQSYGGRGVRVCERWMNSFADFLFDMGARPSLAHTVDRIDVNGHYEPGNCRWATPKQQGRNTRRNRMIEVDGRTQCLAAWAEEMGVSGYLILDRITRLGWSASDAVFTPADKRFGPRRTA